MEQRKDQLVPERLLQLIEQRWRLLVVIAWLIMCAWFLYQRWRGIHAFGLGDTDDNMRMMQVRALLHGQDWYDLRQYRLNPPTGANIHWSRIVDLPIAGVILALRPFFGGVVAEKAAVAIAPMLPLLPMLFGLTLIVRRLVGPRAYVLLFVSLFFAPSTANMFMPLRIDHHGWQLALLATGMAGIADPNRVRGGLVLGLATAASLSIGLEMLIYLAIAGAAMALFWVADREQSDRLMAYALSVGGGTAAGYLLFASRANAGAVCDALSLVWTADAMLGAGLLFVLARLSPAGWPTRLALAAAGGVAVAAFHALAWPHCLQRLEGVSPEVEQLWLSHVREARPIFKYDWRTATNSLALPLTGLIGWGALIWARRRDADALRKTLAIAAAAVTAILLLGWQTRTGPAAQMFGAVGATALVALLLPAIMRVRQWPVQALALGLVLVIGLGGAYPLVSKWLPVKKATPRDMAIGRANRLCNSMAGMRAVAVQPKGLVFTFVDLGPRLITVTRHSAIAGPYHRNGEQIGDIMRAFRGSEAYAKAIIADTYRADYVLICPNSSTTTIFLAEAPKGFYGQLSRGQVPGWLEPVKLPANSPFRMWRVRR